MARYESLRKSGKTLNLQQTFTFRTIFHFLINNSLYIIGPRFEKGVVLES